MRRCTTKYGMTLEEAKDLSFMVPDSKFDWNCFQMSHFKLSFVERALLYRIEEENIKMFFFCDDSAQKDVDRFWQEATTKGIPNMLRWLFINSKNLEFSVSFYVKACDRVLLFTSSSIIVDNFYDVEMSVTALCKTLKSEMENYLFVYFGISMAECTAYRLRLNVNRTKNIGDKEHFMDISFPIPRSDELHQHEQSVEKQKLALFMDDLMANTTNGLSCKRCGTKFILLSSLEFHQKLKCWEEVIVDSLDPAFEPRFPCCVPITQNEHNYSWYGVTCSSEFY